MELINEKFVACCQRAVQDFRLRVSGLRLGGLRVSAEASAEELGPDKPGQAGGAKRTHLGVSQGIFPCPVKTWGSIEND